MRYFFSHKVSPLQGSQLVVVTYGMPHSNICTIILTFLDRCYVLYICLVDLVYQFPLQLSVIET